jgi:hypothetical protein
MFKLLQIFFRSEENIFLPWNEHSNSKTVPYDMYCKDIILEEMVLCDMA